MAGGNLQQQYENIHAWALDAMEHWDALPAWSIYRELEKFLETLPAEQKQAPELAKELAILRRNLLVVGFPALPREEAVRLFREHILDFFRVDVDFKERLLARYTFVGYGEKDEERKQLQEAILQSSERLGQSTIGEWIKLFEQRFKLETRDKQAAVTFLTQTGEVAALGKSEQSILRQILTVYDQYIAHIALDEFDLAALQQNTGQGQSDSSFMRQSSGPRGLEQKNAVSLPLLQALSKYENLGNQLITGGRIKVKSQPEPVRPSLLYWLKYYRDELGIGQHNSVERADFLFRSENGRKLSSEERERMSLILKSVEENLPLSIDPARQEIIFPASNAFSVTSAGEPAFQDAVLARPDTGGMTTHGKPLPVQSVSSQPKRDESAPVQSRRSEPFQPVSHLSSGAKVIGTPAFFVPKAEEAETREEGFEKKPLTAYLSHSDEKNGLRIGRGTSFNVAKETPPSTQAKSISFSTSHVFPAEREVAKNRTAALGEDTSPVSKSVSAPVSAPKSAPVPPRPVQQPMNSFRIRPVSLGGKDQ